MNVLDQLKDNNIYWEIFMETIILNYELLKTKKKEILILMLVKQKMKKEINKVENVYA